MVLDCYNELVFRRVGCKFVKCESEVLQLKVDVYEFIQSITQHKVYENDVYYCK